MAACSLPDGLYSVQVKKYRNTRTNNQNAYLWGVVYPAVMQGFIDMGWDEITNVDMVHEIFKAKFLTTKKDTQKFTTYVERITDFAREYLKTEIPDMASESKTRPFYRFASPVTDVRRDLIQL